MDILPDIFSSYDVRENSNDDSNENRYSDSGSEHDLVWLKTVLDDEAESDQTKASIKLTPRQIGLEIEESHKAELNANEIFTRHEEGRARLVRTLPDSEIPEQLLVWIATDNDRDLSAISEFDVSNRVVAECSSDKYRDSNSESCSNSPKGGDTKSSAVLFTQGSFTPPRKFNTKKRRNPKNASHPLDHGQSFDWDAAYLPTVISKDDIVMEERIIELSSNQQLLAKTIENSSWSEFLNKLENNKTISTSTTLPPPEGKGMRLYGSETKHGVGLLWDVTKLDLTDVYAWPSGYFAKSEYNVDRRTGKLLNGREKYLVSVDELRRQNITFQKETFDFNGHQVSKSQMPVVPFNEVLARVSADALVGVMVRNSQYRTILFAMGVQELVLKHLSIHIPLVLWHPDLLEVPNNGKVTPGGIRIISPNQQQQIVYNYVMRCKRFQAEPFDDEQDHVPPQQFHKSTHHDCLINVKARFPSMKDEFSVQFYGAFGCQMQFLKSVIPSIADMRRRRAESCGESTLGSVTSCDTNSSSYDCVDSELDQTGSLRYKEASDRIVHLQRLEQEDMLDCSIFQRLVALGLHGAISTNNTVTAELIIRRAIPAIIMDGHYFALNITHWLCRDVHNYRMLVVLGAYKAVGSFVAGETILRIKDAVHVLRNWLAKSDSLFFRIESWRKLQLAGKHSGIFPFITGKAVVNRRSFCKSLELLQDKCRDGFLPYLIELQMILHQLSHPCIRLELLLYILGLDARWSLQMVLEVCALCVDTCPTQS